MSFSKSFEKVAFVLPALKALGGAALRTGVRAASGNYRKPLSMLDKGTAALTGLGIASDASSYGDKFKQAYR